MGNLTSSPGTGHGTGRGSLLRRFFRVVRISVMLFMCAAAGLTISGLTENTFPADVIVVPGNAVSPEGKPSDRLAARLDRALELYQEGMGKVIIVSGGTGWQGVDEAAAMRGYLLSRGVKEEHIVQDSQGNTTYDTVNFTQSYMKKHGLTSALAVTQYFHIPRTCMALERAGVSKVGKSHAHFFEWRDLYSTLREVPAYLYYWVR